MNLTKFRTMGLRILHATVFALITMPSAFNSSAFGNQKEIIVEEGYACMGDDKSRNQTEQEAILSAKRNALTFSYAYISSRTEVQDSQLIKDVVLSATLANVKVLQILERGWIRDIDRGECFKIKIKAEIEPDIKAIEAIKNKYLGLESKSQTWTNTTVSHYFPMLTTSEEKKLHLKSVPFPERNVLHWTRQKNYSEAPDKIKATLTPFSIKVSEHGFKILEVIKNIVGTNHDKITFGWKIKMENNTKHNVWAYAGYALYDVDDYFLLDFGKDWDNDETGTLLKPGSEVILKGIGEWVVPNNTKPHPLDRISYGDYKLFLRHSMFQEGKR